MTQRSCYSGSMSLRQQVSLSHETLALARCVHVLTGDSYSEIMRRGLQALLASDPELARRVEAVRKALAA